MKVVIITLLSIIVIIYIVLQIMSEIAFYLAYTKHKKTKEEAFDYLKEKNILDLDIYNEIESEEVSIRSKDNLKLVGYLIEKYKESNKFIILVHGFTANHHVHMPFVRMFLNEGFNILLIDERNHGKSEGKYPSYGYFEQDDLNRWIEFIYKRYNNKNIFLGLHGQSMGGATVLMCGSKNDKVDFIIDDCGYSDSIDVMKNEIKNVNKFLPSSLIISFLKIKARLRIGYKIKWARPIDDIVTTDKPILFIHGDADKKVPCQMAIDMYNARKNPNDKLFIVKGAAHMYCYPIKKKEYESIVHEFIANAEKIKKNDTK